jgi:hypothetical protein
LNLLGAGIMKRIFAGLVCLLLANCAPKVALVTPEIEAQMRQELVSGRSGLPFELCRAMGFAQTGGVAAVPDRGLGGSWNVSHADRLAG